MLREVTADVVIIGADLAGLVAGAILTHNSNHLAREFTFEEISAIDTTRNERTQTRIVGRAP